MPPLLRLIVGAAVVMMPLPMLRAQSAAPRADEPPVCLGFAFGTWTPAPGDPVVGRALAFVANGAVKPPEAKVRAWRVECRRSP